MINNIDWFYLRNPLIMFFSALVIAMLMIFAGAQYENAQYEKYQQSLSTLRTAHQLYSNIINDIDLLEQYRSQYGEYKASGVVGVERRLSWIESLESTNEVLQLPTISYSLLPQEEFARPGFTVKRGVDVKGSAMDLTMGLLHEEDLFALLEGLRLSIKNIFTVESCSLRRTGSVASSLDTRRANLDARCRLRWISIDAK